MSKQYEYAIWGMFAYNTSTFWLCAARLCWTIPLKIVQGVVLAAAIPDLTITGHCSGKERRANLINVLILLHSHDTLESLENYITIHNYFQVIIHSYSFH